MLDKSQKSRVISAATLAAVSDVINLTNDRIEALAGGHGMVNIAIHSIANVVTEEMLNGRSIDIKFANKRSLSMEDVMLKAINAAKKSGADGANAALLTAAIMLLAGSPAQVGIPAGNRKLGATARMLAGVDRSGVAAIPTAKMNNKISGFPAVQAIYQAMIEGKLSPIDGRKVPVNVGGGPMYGHSLLGEDIVWPAMAENGARIGTQAMLDAMAGASMVPHPFTAAILGSAAILEIIHSDAEVPEDMGVYGRTNATYLVGKSAVATAGLPAKLHMQVTGEEYDTAQLVGDIGIILKDIGAPSVIGMMALEEVLSCFQEGISGFSGGPVNAPLGHVGAYAIIGMKTLLANNGDKTKAAKAMTENRMACSLDPESAMVCINIITRKAMELKGGPVTDTLLLMTEPTRANAIYKRAEYAYESIMKGKTVKEVVKDLDDKRLAVVESQSNTVFTAMVGKPIEIKVTKLGPSARRKGAVIKKYWAFDPYADVVVKAGDDVAEMKGFVHDIVPKVAQGQKEDIAWAVPLAAAVMCELTLAGNNIINVVVPAAVAAAMGANTAKEAAELAESGAYITAGIPGSKAAAEKVANLAISIINCDNSIDL